MARLPERSACGEEMEERHVLGPGKPLPHAREAAFPPYAPGRGKLGVEIDGAFKAQRLEYVRQGIHDRRRDRAEVMTANNQGAS